MKYLSRFLFIAIGAIAFFSSCKKVGDLPSYGHGVVPTLSSSATAVAAKQADSSSAAITFSWSDPKYATSFSNTKYILQLDAVGNNFSKAITKTVTGVSSVDFSGKEINSILFDHYKAVYGTVYDMEARVISSYTNNNDQFISNTVAVTMTPYPKLIAPSTGALFIVGDATQGGWTNPVPVPSQQFTKVDDYTFTGVFDLKGGGQFLVLPLNGDWVHKYNIQDNTIDGIADGGDFGLDQGNTNFVGPERDGQYRIVMDFYNGKFTVTQIHAFTPPDSLFIVGGATPGGWANPVPDPEQAFAKTADPNIFEITVHLNAGDSYLLLPVNGSWDHKFGGKKALNGTLFADNDVPGSNTPAPDESGDYKITVNFDTGKYSLEKQ